MDLAWILAWIWHEKAAGFLCCIFSNETACIFFHAKSLPPKISQ